MDELHWILTIAFNNQTITYDAISTFLRQDVGYARVVVIDNSTRERYEDDRPEVDIIRFRRTPRLSVAECWNTGLQYLFHRGAGEVLVCNNDVLLLPHTYRALRDCALDFPTAIGSRSTALYLHCTGDYQMEIREPVGNGLSHDLADPRFDRQYSEWLTRPHPHFSCFLMRKPVWDKVGEFDENFQLAYCEDNDYHCRLHLGGLSAGAIDLPFYHYDGVALKTLDEREHEQLQHAAEGNREYFKFKWGFGIATPEYDAFFQRPPFSPEVEEHPPCESCTPQSTPRELPCEEPPESLDGPFEA